MSESNINGYYVVEVDDFVYNPRISVHAPVGPIKNKKSKNYVATLHGFSDLKKEI